MFGKILSSNSGWIKIGDENVVYDIKSNHPVVKYENLYSKTKEYHEKVGHHGRDGTWMEVCSMNIYNRITQCIFQVKDQYVWVPLRSIKLFLSQCDVCSNRKAFPKGGERFVAILAQLESSGSFTWNFQQL